MNSSQLAGILRAVIPGIAGYLAGKGLFFDSDTWNIILGSLATAVVAGFSAKAHTASSAVTAASEVPGVTIAVGPAAPASVQAVAVDPAVPTVNVARPDA